MSAPWPQDQTDTLTRLWQAGRTSGEIASVMNITRSMVMGKASRLGLKHQRITKPPVNYVPRVSRSKPKKPPTPLKPQAPTPHPIPFIEADYRHCKWPLWSGPRTGNVCGAIPVPAAPYCPYHYDKAFTELWSRRKPA